MPWNPLDKHTTITLSVDDTVATANVSSASIRNLRAVDSRGGDGGKYQFELVPSVGDSTAYCAFLDSGHTFTTPPGNANYGYGVSGAAIRFVDIGGVDLTETVIELDFDANDTVTFAIDFDALTLDVYLNGVLGEHIDFLSSLGSIYPAAGLRSGAAMTLIEAISEMSYPVDDYIAWDGSTAGGGENGNDLTSPDGMANDSMSSESITADM